MTESNSDAPTPEGADGGPSAEQKSTRNPDAELRLDGEEDSLYSDGLDVGHDTESYAGTDGDAPKGIKG
jgi:hypothetical protein